ncbi:DNA repair protein REV1 isoform X3 [Diospyros lotus]|uniref:DNA repair protein REV1 isoform X3 n=1 Tax=Diospyros lotus TaxID=55363 RepID=UPI00225BAA87|nr:DNA repair protein REV1 isoform X3 [Diospyros lotus]
MSFNSTRSANSGSRSKRSFNSLSSNPSSNGNNKKRKTTQKTLGVGWGSNSRSSSRSSFRNSPFSDFGSYMEVKNRKLQEQFNAEASSSSNSGSTSGKPIFQGVSIFVDGFTVPSSQELRGYMLKHGGRFENYFSRHHVTHIICSNLPDSKIKNLRSFSGGLPVVKPSWLMDSIAANKLLSWVPYQLDQIASEAHNQPKISVFFASESSLVSKDSETCVTGQIKPKLEDPSAKSGTIKETNLSESCGSMQHSEPTGREWDDSVGKNIARAVTQGPVCIERECSEGKSDKGSDVCTIGGNTGEIHDQASPSQPFVSVSSYITKRSTRPTVVEPSNWHRSTLHDPNFVENYFKSSRLHFIGTWRNRYRRRFPSFGYTSSSVNVSTRRTSIIHVDMDCFFVSVVIRKHSELQDKPVAICHSDNPRGTAEISSANYPARGYGVRAGMFLRDAKALCPHLVIFPYNFEAYEEVADQFYNILHKHCKRVQAVSCDEAFLDVTDAEVEDPQFLASVIRKEIFETTRCTASAGIAGNLLMARLATRAAKPDGQRYIPPEMVDDYLHELPIKELPGIGHVLEEKLMRRHIQTCGQLRRISKESLQKELGIKTGDMLWNYCRGIDNRLESKSMGAEVNWGVRFNDLKDCHHFLMNLCKEVLLRLQGCAVQGRNFTLKIKKRRSDAEEPAKYMGCGDCENLSHSTTVPLATDDEDVIRRIMVQLFGSFHIDVKDIRGMGLQVSKLESTDTAKPGHERNSIRSWLTSASASTKEQHIIASLAKESANRDFGEQSIDVNQGWLSTDSTGPSVQIGTNLSNANVPLDQDSALPSIEDLDLGVVESLPPDLFAEINDMYGGKLNNMISKKKCQNVDVCNSLCSMLQGRVQVAINEVRESFGLDPDSANVISVEDKEDKYEVEKIHAEAVSGVEPSKAVISSSVPDKMDLMPSSLSQVDISVLQQLPEDLRVDVLGLLPAHRRPEGASFVALGATSKSESDKCPENQTGSINPILKKELWFGDPPEWVKKFKNSDCSVLRILADMYYKSGSTSCLSSILQRTLSDSKHFVNASSDAEEEAISCLCDLLQQYIELKIETDIEEVYVCFRLLRSRFTMRSEFVFQSYSLIYPRLQAFVRENYGGTLLISDGKD